MLTFATDADSLVAVSIATHLSSVLGDAWLGTLGAWTKTSTAPCQPAIQHRLSSNPRYHAARQVRPSGLVRHEPTLERSLQNALPQSGGSLQIVVNLGFDFVRGG
jgi:hypothetical protein